MADIATRISIYAKDQASDAFRKVGREADDLTARLTKLGPGLTKALAGLGAGFGLSQVLQQAQEYETAVVNMARVTDRSFAQVKADVAQLGPELGNQTDLMRGYYAVMSAGVTDSAQALDLLAVASKGSKVAGVTQAQTITALTKLMAGYAGEIKSATEASDLLFSIEKQGQTTFAELVPVIGDAAAISKQAGVSADEMAATLSAITQTAGGTSQAVTQYRAVLTALVKPQEQMTALLKRMGYQSGVALIQEKGLAGALLTLRDAAEKSGVGLGKLFESSEALTALGPLLASDFERVASNLDVMRAKGSATEKAFANWRNTLAGLRETTANLFADLATEAGNLVAPQAARDLRALNDALAWLRDNFDAVVQFAGGAAVALTALGAAQRVAASDTALHAREAANLEWKQLTGKAVILGSAQAVAQKAAAEVAAADAERKAAAAALEKFRAEQSVTVATRSGTQAAIVRAAQEKQLAALTAASAAAETRYAAALKASEVAARQATLAGRALNGVKAAASGLVGILGGPLAAGFAAVAVAGYAVHTSMQGTSDLLETYRGRLNGVSDAAEQAGKKLSALDAAMARSAREMAARELEKAQADFERIRKLAEQTDTNGGPLTYIASTKERFLGYEEGTLKAAEAMREYQRGTIDAYEAQRRLIAIREQFGRTDSVEKALEWVEALVGALKAAEDAGKKLDDTNARLDETGDAARGAAEQVEGLAAAMALLSGQQVTPATSLDAAIKSLREYTKETKSAKEEAAKFAKETAQANLEQIRRAEVAARDAGKVKEADALAAEYRTQQARIAEVGQKSTGRRKSGSGGTSGVESGQRALMGLNAEMEKLRGSGDSFGETLSKKLAEIARTGKQAGLSLAEVGQKQEEYKAAFQTGTLRDFDRQLMQLTNDTRGLKQLEIDEQVRAWTGRFQAAGIGAEDAAQRVERLKAAMESQARVQDLQSAVNFYRELSGLSGEYTDSLEIQNELIALQAQLHKQNGIPPEQVERWEKLQKLQIRTDFAAGATRGLMKFGEQFGDTARQVETLTANMGNTISSTLSDAFMTGEFSAKKFFNSLMSMAVQAMSNFLVGQLFKGVGMSFGFGVAHTGGVVGQTALPMRAVSLEVFWDAPRYHTGGAILAPGEVPIIAQTGERVLTRSQNAEWERGLRPQGGGPINLTVSIENKSGQPLAATQGGTQWSGDMRSAVVSIVLDAVNRNYMGARDALRG